MEARSAPAARLAPPSPAVEGERGWRRRAALLLGVALALRVAVVAQATALPLLDTPLYDSDVYLHQARQIRAGRFDDPALLAYSPLYGWLLAALGGSVRGAVALQLAMGLCTIGLVMHLVRRRAGERGALLAGALLCGYGLPLFYETKILSETLGLLLATAGLLLFAADDERPGRAARAGVVLALSVLARASLLFTLPLYVVVALLASPARIGRALALACGMAVVLVGNGLWNRAHTGLFVPVILVSRTAAVATRAEWTGDFRVFARDGGAGDVSPWDVVRQAEERIARVRRGEGEPVAPIAGGIDPVGWLRGAPAKLARTVADRETTFDYGYYGERSELTALRALPVSFGLLEVLALAGALGLFLSGGGRSLLPLLPLLCGTLVTTTLFYPTSRYRLPAVIALVAMAAEVVPSLARMAHAPDGRRRARVATALLAACALAFAVRTVSRRPESAAEWELRVAEAAGRAGDLDELHRRVARARALAPGDASIEHRIEVIGGGPRPGRSPR